MNIVHLNTHAYGGAAVVARRLHQAALEHGHQSRLVTRFGVRDRTLPHFTPLHGSRLRYTLRALSAQPQLYRLGKFVQRKLEPRQLTGRPGGYEIFSPLNERPRYYDLGARFQPDVFHLHWINGFVDHAAFFEHNRTRRFVWTLHDMNPFTGGCHHSAGCMNFRAECRQCPQLAGTADPDYSATVLTAKERALGALRDDQLIVVAPSQWLLDLARQSRVLSRFRHVLIENPAFAKPPNGAGGSALPPGFAPGRKHVVFVSDNLRNPQKGVSLLFAAVRRLNAGDAVRLVGIGQRTDAPADVPVTFVGRIKDERALARYLAAADVVVLASAAENSPLVLIEALTCGTPVLAFAVGGVPELINETNGVLLHERNEESLAQGLRQVLFERRFDRAQIREQAERFRLRNVWQKYAEVYGMLVHA